MLVFAICVSSTLNSLPYVETEKHTSQPSCGVSRLKRDVGASLVVLRVDAGFFAICVSSPLNSLPYVETEKHTSQQPPCGVSVLRRDVGAF